MADQTLTEIREVQERNKAIAFKRKQDAITKIRDLLENFSKKQLFDMIEDEVDNG